MELKPRDRLIQLRNLSRDVVDEKKGRRTALREVNVILSSRDNIAIMASEPDFSTTFLHLIAGSDVPDRGKVITDGLRCSPIINSGGAATSLVPQMSPAENIGFFARLHAIDRAALVRLVDLACGLGSRMQEPVRKLDGQARRSLETALIAALPYDCYLIDRFDILLPEHRWLISRSVKARDASMIFVTENIRLAKKFGTSGLVIEKGKLRAHAALHAGFRAYFDQPERQDVPDV